MSAPPLRLASVALALALLASIAVPGTARAGGETIKRSFENMLQAPFDLALSPVVAGKSLYTNLRDQSDSTAVRWAYPVPGYFWLTGVQMGASVLRGISGVLTFPIGVALLPFDYELPVLFDPADRGAALVDKDTPPFHFKFGIDYTSPPS